MARRPKPPQPRIQVSVRIDPETIERLEERALEETMRLGVTVRMADIVRRGAVLALAEPLPSKPKGMRRCSVVPSVEGNVCLECKASWAKAMRPVCPRDGEPVSA